MTHLPTAVNLRRVSHQITQFRVRCFTVQYSYLLVAHT